MSFNQLKLTDFVSLAADASNTIEEIARLNDTEFEMNSDKEDEGSPVQSQPETCTTW
jgi:hypothetical protein